jgi:hypothetical protein
MSLVGRTSRALLLAALLAMVACGAEGPVTPPITATTILVEYLGPDTSSLPPPLDPMCPHHYAPVNLRLETSWGATGRMESVGNRLYRYTFSGVPVGQDHWLTLFDIDLCRDASSSGPLVRSGVSVNGIPLTRTTTTPAGVPALAFHVDARGVVGR